jgi:ABC-type bacteriocin/lantibiotic exporter with double-glycine peptidase domain
VYLNAAYEYFQFTSDNNFITVFGVAIIIILALSNICLSGVTALIYFYSGKRNHSISMRLLEKYLRQQYIFYLNTNTSELIRKVISDVNVFVNKVLITSLQSVSSSIIVVCIVILLIIVSPTLAFVTSILFASAYFILFIFVRRFLARKGAEGHALNILKFKYIAEMFGGIKDVKILGKEVVFLKLFSGPSRKSAMNSAISDVCNDVPKYILETLAFSGILAIIIFMISSGTSFTDFLPVLTVYAFGAYRLLPTLQKIFRAVSSIKFNLPVIESLVRDVLELSDGDPLETAAIPRMPFQHALCLKNIVFHYPNSDKEVIRGQSLTIKANTSIALVGATGCGKTTLVDIVLGLLLPQEGGIFVDDMRIDDENRKSWQRNIGYVPQSIYLTDDSIQKNIAFGIAPEKIDDEAVKKAAQLANIHDFVMNELKNGYDTLVGERGVRLSGGQRQRIGIARAIYHDPSVLILDEATSALDGLTENAIIDAIRNLSHEKTIIMIAHRLTTVKHCDVIYMMEKGEFVDSGAYDELYEKNAAFRKMADGNYN